MAYFEFAAFSLIAHTQLNIMEKNVPFVWYTVGSQIINKKKN